MPHITAPVNPEEDENSGSFLSPPPDPDIDVDGLDEEQVREELKKLLNMDEE